MKISVVIPTHNRPENLLITLKSVYESVKEKLDVLILIEPKSNSLPKKEYLESLSDRLNIIIKENEFNIGCDESIIRSFEYFKSQWIYFLGDSKPVRKDAFKIINEKIKEFPHAKAHHFRFDSFSTRTYEIKSISELVSIKYPLGDFILGGNYLVSKEIIDKYIRYAYRVLTSRIANSAMSLMSLQNNVPITVSSERIIDRFLEKPSNYDPGDDLANCWASFPILCMLPLSYKNAKLLNKYILDFYKINDLVIFVKYILLKLFRYKQNNVPKLVKNVISTRYIFYANYFEKSCLVILYLFSKLISYFMRF